MVVPEGVAGGEGILLDFVLDFVVWRTHAWRGLGERRRRGLGGGRGGLVAVLGRGSDAQVGARSVSEVNEGWCYSSGLKGSETDRESTQVASHESKI